MTNPFGHNPFEPKPFDSGSVGMQGPAIPSPLPSHDEANVLATLSVVFAFVFAPVGAILGHLGLSQIRRTGQRGRDRALVGVTLSYVFITVAVVALIVGSTVTDTSPARVAAPASTTASAPTTTTPPPPPPPPPTVAPADLDGLLPSLDEIENITGDSAMTVLRTYNQLTRDPRNPVIDRPECSGAFDAGIPEAYDLRAVLGYYASVFLDVKNPHQLQWIAYQGVAAFADAGAAQTQLAKLQSTWRQCGGSTVNATWPGGRTFPVSMSVPADAGNGITTLEVRPRTPISLFDVRAVAAKANVVIDVITSSTMGTDRSRQAALDIVNYILGKIPG
jgi:eukaryotic-like serine/threonine-protein kinase